MKKIYLIITIGVLLLGCKKNNQDFDASGVFESTEVLVSSEVNGKILELNIEEGQSLELNQTIGLIDTVQLYLKKQQLIFSTKGVQSRKQDIATQISAIKQQIITAKREKTRIERLLANNAANKKQLDDINSQISVLESQLAAQTSSLEKGNNAIGSEKSALEVQISQIEDQLKRSRISSPIKGVVLVKYSQEGEVTSAGKPLFKIADVDNMILRAYITSEQLSKIKLGQEIRVFADYGESRKEYKGKVSWISSKAEFTPKSIQVKEDRDNLVYAIKVGLKNDGYLKIGMYADILF